MMEIYPFGGLLAYLKYNYLDGIEKQYLLLIDKTRIKDYSQDKKVAIAQNPKSQEQVFNMTKMFGVGTETEEQISKVRKEIGD